MNIKSINDERSMNYEYYLKQLMEIVDLKLNMIIFENVHLINSPDRTINHTLIRKYSNIPFTNKKMC